jgi:hypothetical protein
MKGRIGIRMVGAALAAMALAPTVALAAKGKLEGFQEVPSVSTTGSGKCTVKPVDGALAVTLEYAGVTGTVTQAHVHFGQPGVNGGIMFFICTNLGNGPMGTPACPAAPSTVTRTVPAADILAIAGQGLGAGDLEAVVLALKKKATYCNVHTSTFPGGEVRALLK